MIFSSLKLFPLALLPAARVAFACENICESFNLCKFPEMLQSHSYFSFIIYLFSNKNILRYCMLGTCCCLMPLLTFLPC